MKGRTRKAICILIAVITLTPFAFTQSPDTSGHTITLTYDHFHFDKQFPEDWKMAGLEYKKETSLGAILGHLNFADRLGRKGWQIGGEAYPKFSKKTYAYIGFDYSNNVPVFPKFRSGVSVFVNLPAAWEIEGGLRYLYFDRSVWIGTAGISKYAGQWLFNIRSFITKANEGIQQSYFLNARYYFGEKNHYSWIQLGSGISPDENRNVQLHSTSHLLSKRISGGLKYFVAKKHIALISIGYSRDEYLPGISGNQIFGTIGYGVRF